MRRNLEHVRDFCDQQIKAGQIQDARAQLRKLTNSKLPGSMIATFADLSRRAGLFHLGLKWLNSRVRPEVKHASPATPDEQIGYAALLIKVGCYAEAQELLEAQSSSRPDVQLYKAFVRIHRWEYSASTPLLERFLSHKTLGSYQRMVGQVNLAAAYVALDDFENGEALLNEILRETQEQGWTLFLKNALELQVQLASAQKNWPAAHESLNRAISLMEPGSISSLYVLKWRTVLEFREYGVSEKVLNDFAKLRALAEQLGDWNTVRECDLHLALATRDEDLMQKIYYGTPNKRYRERLARLTGDWMNFRPQFVISLDGTKPARVFDLTQGKEIGNSVALELGSVTYRILKVLASDLYQPRPLSCLFALVYPDEYFDPYSSAKRILQQIHRLRSWLEQNRIPLVIHHCRDGYILRANGSYGLLMTLEETAPPCQKNLWLRTLKKVFENRRFKSSEAAQAINVSTRTMQNFLVEAERNRWIRKSGRGRATSYQLRRTAGIGREK